jgi:predicted dehydrogenase
VQHPNVDLVSICLRVPFHHQIGIQALNAGKHLFCEWPLAATTAQAQELRDLVARRRVCHTVGLQARGSRAINYVRDLVAQGYVGRVLSCTTLFSTPQWGPEFTESYSYLADDSSGASLLDIHGGHMIDALCYCVGKFKTVSAVLATQRPQVKVIETGKIIQMTSPDHILVSGILQSGAVASVNIKGGASNATEFIFEIHGTDGDLAIVPADSREVRVQIADQIVRGTKAGKQLEILPIPESYRWVPTAMPAGLPLNVGQLFVRMAEGIREGKAISPNFNDAVELHQLLDAIQKASDTGARQAL